MSYLVLARKYRPLNFGSVSGQEHVTRTLCNAIKRGKIAHAYLFAGPRGVGKTSIARIFAKALNCGALSGGEPCLECTNCREITEGSSLAVREIDGASHNSVDNVRELIESFRSLPPPGSAYKIYIIDEVHMLSTAAFNALLKSLEEPPPHTLFILATTEAHKIPQTVISRCQRFDFRALGGREIERCLTQIAESERLPVEPEVFRMIARQADGSMRDAQSLLDRVQSFCEGEITASETEQVLGIVKHSTLFSISEAVLKRDAAAVLQLLDDVFAGGIDPTLFLREFVSHWRELLLARFGGEAALKRIGVSPEQSAWLIRQAKATGTQDMLDLVQIAREGSDQALRSTYPKYALEAMLVRMSCREPVKDLGVILGRLKMAAAKEAAVSRKAEPAPERRAEDEAASIEREPAAAAPEAAVEAPAPPPADLSWERFVDFSAEKGARIINEHLRRFTVNHFSPGRLELQGPEFSVASLENRDNQERLRRLLEEFSLRRGWVIKLIKGAGGSRAEKGSLAEVEEDRASQRRSRQVEDIKNHPKVQSLKKVFPGSTIENIKMKE